MPYPWEPFPRKVICRQQAVVTESWLRFRNVFAGCPRSVPVESVMRMDGVNCDFAQNDDFSSTRQVRHHRHGKPGDHTRRGHTRSRSWDRHRNGASLLPHRRSDFVEQHVLPLLRPSSHRRQLWPP